MKTLARLVEKLSDAEDVVFRLEEELKAAKRAVSDLAEREIPNHMDSLEVQEFTTTSGLKIKIAEKFYGKQMTESNTDGMQWLHDNHESGLIKNMIMIPFGSGGDDDAAEAAKKFEAMGYSVERTTKVNPQSLAAMCRAKTEEGADVPLQMLGVYERRVAKVTK